jgi:hypothetical protein
MRSRIILTVTIYFILGVTVKSGHAEKTPWYNFRSLENKSDIIASGKILFKDGNPVLITDQILKGRAPEKLTIINYTSTKWLEVDFVENEDVLLFLRSIDENSAQLTEGNYAKWPRHTVNGYSDIVSEASIESIADLVNEIRRIESETEIGNRVDILRNWLDSSKSLLNLLALEYVFWGHIWSNESSPDSHAIVVRDSILEQLSIYAFRSIQSDIPLIRAGSIFLLKYADPESALPILINKITDSNDRVREFTRKALNSFPPAIKSGGRFDYDYNDSTEKLLPVQRKWQEWYDSNYGK